MRTAAVRARTRHGTRHVPTLAHTAPRARSVPSSQQLAYFFVFVATGGVFLALAFLLFLPVIILTPSKFALSFTMGCMLIMTGFAQLRGWKQQLQHMLGRDRLVFTSGTCARAGRPGSSSTGAAA